MEIDAEGSIIDVLIKIDKNMMENHEKSIFPLYKGLMHCYLQLIWDVEENKIYEDYGVEAYGSNKKFISLREDVNYPLSHYSEITITVHAD
ncbi:MAG: hypothetical protein ACTSXH_12710 [Promethearchaeota archaeon]